MTAHADSSTRTVPAQDCESWLQDPVCALLLHSHFERTDVTMACRIAHWQAGAVALHLLTGSTRQVQQQLSQIALEDCRRFSLLFQHQGQCAVEQAGRRHLLTPGEVLVGLGCLPSVLEGDQEYSLILLLMETALLGQLTPSLEHLAPVKFDRWQPETALLHHTAYALLRCMESPGPHAEQACQHMQRALLHTVLAAAQKPYDPPLPATGNRLAHYHWQRMEAFISSHLDSARLDAAAVAQAASLSVSQAHRIYRSMQQSMADSIWSKRLAAIQQDLCNPALRPLSIQAIAYRWGFADAAHCSRLFKARLGVSPKQYRKAHQATSG